jgi:integrase
MGVYLRGNVWYADFYSHGNRVRIVTAAKSKREAQDALAVEKGSRLQSHIPELDLPLDRLRIPYLDFLAGHRAAKTHENVKSMLEVFVREMAPGELSDITTEMVHLYVARKRGHLLPSSINLTISALKGMFTWGVKHGIIAQNPLRNIELLRIGGGQRLRYLSIEEVEKLLRVAEGTKWKPVLLVALKTGIRRSEVVNLQWADVDLTNLCLWVKPHPGEDDTKNHKARSIPLDNVIRELLEALRAEAPKAKYVFEVKPGRKYKPSSVAIGVQRIVKRAGLEDVTFHTFRHTFASHLVMAGVDLATVKELLGHSTIAMTLRYAHLSQDHKIEAVKKLPY